MTKEQSQKLDLEIAKIQKEIRHMTFKEFIMGATFFTLLGASIAKLF